MGRPQTEKTRKKISRALKEQRSKAAWRKKKTEENKRTWADPEIRAKRMAGIRKRFEKNPNAGREWKERMDKIREERKEALRLLNIARPKDTGSSNLPVRAVWYNACLKVLEPYGVECLPDQPIKYYEEIITALDPSKLQYLKK